MEVEAWLHRAAAARSDRPAIEAAGEVLSYAELEHASGVGAAALDLAPGERVALDLPAGSDFAVALHACLRAGAVAVPVDPRAGAAERAAIVRGCAGTVDRPLPRSGPTRRWRAHRLEEPAVVMHTSGTSGSPRAVELTYGNWLWSALGSATALGLDPAERWLCTLPLAHVGGLSILIRSAIYGTTALLEERFEASAVAEILMGGSATAVSLVPTTLRRLLGAGLDHPPALRFALVGGAPLDPALLERARTAGVAVSQTYGLTEACSQVTTQTPGDGGDDAGPPLFCTQVRIASSDGGSPVGEILVRGPTVAGRGWLATGDLGELRAGRLRVCGRKGEVIISGGENIAPAEIEAVLAAHPAVREAAVVGVAHPEWGEAVKAIVVIDRDVGEDELRAHCAANLARFKVPKLIEFANRPLPRTGSGKLLRRAL